VDRERGGVWGHQCGPQAVASGSCICSFVVSKREKRSKVSNLPGQAWDLGLALVHDFPAVVLTLTFGPSKDFWVSESVGATACFRGKYVSVGWLEILWNETG
jgi:hypothetical protein